MIKNFKCKHTQALYEGGNPKQFRTFKAQAERKLQMLDAAVTLDFLRSPPGNKLKLKALSGKGWGNTALELINNGVSVLCGMINLMTLKLLIIIKGETR
jgi:proteic killer suppression protein